MNGAGGGGDGGTAAGWRGGVWEGELGGEGGRGGVCLPCRACDARMRAHSRAPTHAYTRTCTHARTRTRCMRATEMWRRVRLRCDAHARATFLRLRCDGECGRTRCSLPPPKPLPRPPPPLPLFLFLSLLLSFSPSLSLSLSLSSLSMYVCMYLCIRSYTHSQCVITYPARVRARAPYRAGAGPCVSRHHEVSGSLHGPAPWRRRRQRARGCGRPRRAVRFDAP